MLYFRIEITYQKRNIFLNKQLFGNSLEKYTAFVQTNFHICEQQSVSTLLHFNDIQGCLTVIKRYCKSNPKMFVRQFIIVEQYRHRLAFIWQTCSDVTICYSSNTAPYLLVSEHCC